MFFNCCLVHPSVMMRRSVLSTFSPLYPEDAPAAEDYALWLKLLTEAASPIILANLPSPPILHLRKHTGNVSVVHRDKQRNSVKRSLCRALQVVGVTVWPPPLLNQISCLSS